MMFSAAAVMTASVGAEELVKPSYCRETSGWFINDFVTHNNNQVTYDVRNTDRPGTGGAVNSQIDTETGFGDLGGLLVTFFFDWDNEDWGDADEGESPWDGHSISIIRQGIHGLARNECNSNHSDRASLPAHQRCNCSRDWNTFELDFVRESTGSDREIVIGSEEVVVWIPLNGTADATWFRAGVASWAGSPPETPGTGTPGRALMNLTDSERNLIRAVCPDCDEPECECEGDGTPGTPGTPGDANPETGLVIVAIPTVAAAGALAMVTFTKKRK
jgi:hypothetical protein